MIAMRTFQQLTTRCHLLLAAAVLGISVLGATTWKLAAQETPTPSESSTPPKGLEFLAPYPKLHGLSLGMTEEQFKALAAREKLSIQISDGLKSDGRAVYTIPTGDGHRVLVGFHDGKCGGIQRLRGEETGVPDPGVETKKLAQAAVEAARARAAAEAAKADLQKRLQQSKDKEGSRGDAAETPPTPETLEKWLQGKECIEVSFGGPHMAPLELRDSLTIKGNATDFRLTPGEGGRPGKGGGAFVEVWMKVTPENVRQVLALQAELAPRLYVLEAKRAKVWSYQGDAKTREQARKLVPEVLAALEQAIKQALPGAECTAAKSKGADLMGGFDYVLQGAKGKGAVRVHSVTSPHVGGAIAPDQTLHLPHLGLIVMQYNSGTGGRPADDSPQRRAIRQAFNEKVEPLRKLDSDARASTPLP